MLARIGKDEFGWVGRFGTKKFVCKAYFREMWCSILSCVPGLNCLSAGVFTQSRMRKPLRKFCAEGDLVLFTFLSSFLSHYGTFGYLGFRAFQSQISRRIKFGCFEFIFLLLEYFIACVLYTVLKGRSSLSLSNLCALLASSLLRFAPLWWQSMIYTKMAFSFFLGLRVVYSLNYL